MIEKFEEVAAQELNLSLELVNNINRFQWKYAYESFSAPNVKTIEVTRIGNFIFMEHRAKEELEKAKTHLYALREHEEIPNREVKIKQVNEKIKALISKNLEG